MLYCIKIDRSGLPEENMVLHHNFDHEPTKAEIRELIENEDCGYDDRYCDFLYYRIY